MGSVKIYDIAARLGCCAECLVEAINDIGTDTFSTVSVLEEKCKEIIQKPANHPFAHKSETGDWAYFCDEHDARFDDPSEYTSHEQEVEILDVMESFEE
jgi:hypothetical protein